MQYQTRIAVSTGGDGDGKPVAHVMLFGNLSSRFVGKFMPVNFTASCFHWTNHPESG